MSRDAATRSVEAVADWKYTLYMSYACFDA